MLLTRVKIENFRSIKSLELDFDQQTVLIGENNAGKTTVLHALRFALDTVRGKKASAFDDFDYHLDTTNGDPHSAPEIRILLEFKECDNENWKDEIVRAVGDIYSLDERDKRVVKLLITSRYDVGSNGHIHDFLFLDVKDEALPPNKSSFNNLTMLQRVRPYFLLSAIRDASKEFSRYSPYWGSFLKAAAIDSEQRKEIEDEIEIMNQKIVDLHTPFSMVRSHLDNLRGLVPNNGNHKVAIEALPGKLFEMLSKTQVTLSTFSGAQVPINRHGEGVQSLSVLMLFDAFLRTKTGQAVDRAAVPLIAMEEPEAHLHPSAVRNLWGTISGLDGQKIITTHSGDLLAEVPVLNIRRLYRSTQGVEVGALKNSTLTEKERRYFDQHIRLTRGELLFANCWILCEGETEAILLREIGRLNGFEMERWGVRIVEYRRADIAMYLKAAIDFGIKWHCLLDNDEQGQKDAQKAKSFLNGQPEEKHLTIVPDPNMDHYLASCGFLEVYESFLGEQDNKKVSASRGTSDYQKQVVKTVSDKRGGKIEAVLRICQRLADDRNIEMPPLVVQAMKNSLAHCGWRESND
jgi:putative ATP-dependent endonuclease of OLD family